MLPILNAAQEDPELGAWLSAYVEENDFRPHRGVKALGAYLRAEQAARRANPDVDAEAVALMLIDAAFGRVARRQMLQTQGSTDRMPSPDRVLDAIAMLLEVRDSS